MKKSLILFSLLVLPVLASGCASDEQQEPTQQKQEVAVDSSNADVIAFNKLSSKNPVYFGFNSDKVQSKDDSLIEKYAISMNALSMKGVKFTLNGYCDNKGSNAYNSDLANRRAKALENALKDKGFKGSVYISNKFANVAKNGNKENRKVEIVAEANK